MKNILCVLGFLASLLIFFPDFSYSLERGYAYSGAHIDDRDPEDEDEYGNNVYYYDSDELCYDCFNEACFYGMPSIHKKELDISAIPPALESPYNECAACCNHAIYSGYLHFRYKGDYLFLKRQIAYSKKYPQHQAYWPETSHKAEKINDIAVILFEELIDSTALKKVTSQSRLSKNFITDSWYFERLRSITLPRSLSACCFRFSDFYMVCKDLENFSNTYFSDKECALIQEKIYVILDRLCGLFLEMYQESLSAHPTDEIQNEMNFIDLLYAKERDIKIKKGSRRLGNSQPFPFESQKLPSRNQRNQTLNSKNPSVSNSDVLPDWLIGDYWLYEGIRCNDLFLHSDAVIYLTAAIGKDPLNIEAYQERSHAYFEMGNLDLAIDDYKKVKQLEANKKTTLINQTGYVFGDGENDQGGYVINPESKGMMDYSGGFFVGITKGGSVSVVEFVPSTWSCCKGILHGLWCFACSPKEVSSDLINASYELIKFIKENTPRECLEVVVPEIKELCENWDVLSDYERGSQTGYIIGKYGVDILAPGAALKGIKKYQQLKRLNSMFTIECCVTSQTEKAKILEASFKHYSARKIVVESVKSGKIVPRNANVIPHVMQEKHAWGRLLKLSGSKEEDFRKVIELLEKNDILSKKVIVEELKQTKMKRIVCKKEISNQMVEAHFVEYDTGEMVLNNAWVQR